MNNIPLRLISCLPLVLTLSTTAFATDWSSLDHVASEWVVRGFYPGAGLWIGDSEGKTLHVQTFGNMSSDTEVYIASAGKWLAAATIAALVDEGCLQWTDTARKFLPELKDTKGDATLRQLLAHTAGYPDYQPKLRHRDDYQTLAESMSALEALSAKYPPGIRFKYGGLAFQVAGRMAELATNQKWEEIFQSRIAVPLGMKHPHLTPVDVQGGGHSPMRAGGARSTLNDYSRFLGMILAGGRVANRQVLSTKAIAALEANQLALAEVALESEFVFRVRAATHAGFYGLGVWREEIDADGKATLLSSPSWAGTYPWVDRKSGVAGLFIAHVLPDGPAKEARFNSFLSSAILAPLARDVVQATLR